MRMDVAQRQYQEEIGLDQIYLDLAIEQDPYEPCKEAPLTQFLQEFCIRLKSLLTYFV